MNNIVVGRDDAAAAASKFAANLSIARKAKEAAPGYYDGAQAKSEDIAKKKCKGLAL